MTYPVYTRHTLQFLKLSALRAIASQIGATVADKRMRFSHIEAILKLQPTKGATSAKVAVAEDTQIADTSEAILDELEITFIDLSIGTDLVVPDGLDAYHAVYNGRVIVEVYNYKGGYVCRRGNGVVYDDPYLAIVNHYEHYNPGAVLLAQAAVDANLEIEAVRAAMMPEYI